jgi:hypothetical protein
MSEQRKRSFKPKYVQSSVPTLFRGWSDWKAGDYIVGKYHSMYETEYKKNKFPNFRIEVTDCNFKIKTKEGKIVNPVGQIIALNSAGQLNKFMAKIEIGMMVDITYGGMKEDKEDPDTKYHYFSDMLAGDEDGQDPVEEEDHSGL